MKLYIYPNIREHYLEDVRRTITLLKEKFHHECYLSQKDLRRLFPEEDPVSFDMKNVDMVVSIGGDGTLILAKDTALEYDKPLIGINTGRLGYLCALSLADLEERDSFEELKETRRTLVSMKINGEDVTALNDIVIGKNNFGATVTLQAEVDDNVIKVRGDGVIISTPTGSTSYSYSAGGPVISHKSKVIAITPICAHYSSSHPLVVDDEQEIRISVINPEANDASVFIDGKDYGLADHQLSVRKYEKQLRLISVPKNILNEH